MLTKGNFRAVKYLVLVVALVAMLAMCLTACGATAVKDVKYVDGSVTKSVYTEGETFDCAGAKITVTYEDDTTETIDVTKAMVGEFVLKGIGEVDVPVIYANEGNTYTTYITVTVENPTKDKAVADLKKDAVAKDHLEDKGVIKLVEAYTLLINNAATKDVATLSAGFSADVKEYVDAKAACLAVINDDSLLEKLYVQNVTKAATEKANALALYMTATEADAFKEIASSYKTAIEKLVADQEFYEGATGSNGQIEDKVVLLKKIKAYKALIDARKDAIVEYQLSQNNTVGAAATKAEFAAHIEWFDDKYEYVTLAINLSTLEKEIEYKYISIMRTSVDDIYEALADIDTALNADGTGFVTTTDILQDGAGITIHLIDKIADLLDDIDGYKADAVDKFGVDFVDALMAAYTPFGADADFVAFNLQDCVTGFKGVYNNLLNAQTAADAVEAAIDEINLSDTSKTKEQHQDSITNAWTALINWNNTYGLLANAKAPTFGIETGAYEIAFGVEIDAIYFLGLGENKVDLINKYEKETITFEYIETYMIENLQKLLDATILGDKIIVDELIAKIPAIIVYGTATERFANDATMDAHPELKGQLADSYAAINAARTAYDIYYNKYFAEYGSNETFFPTIMVDNITVGEMNYTIEVAEEEYNTLKAAAENLRAAIDALPAASAITLKDYQDVNSETGIVTDGALKKAYADYLAFTEANFGFNGVIEADGKEDKLIACMKAYIDLAWKDAKEVEGKKTISGALVDCLNKTDKVEDVALRAQLSAKESTVREAFLAGNDYVHTNNELEQLTNFGAQLDALELAAANAAKEITDLYNAAKN